MADNNALPDTLNMAWFGGNNQEVVDSLDLVGTDTSAVQSLDQFNAYQQSFGLGGGGPENAFTALDDDEGMLSDVEISQSTMDKLTPAIAIGAGEILTRAGDFRIPEGIKPKIRAGGARGVAFTLAVRANKIGYDFAREKLGMTETGATLTGGGATYAAWKTVPSIVNHISSNVKIGMTTEVIESVVEQASKSAYSEIIKQGVEIGASKTNTINAANLAARELRESVQKETADVLKERMGKTAAQGWDDVAKRLMNPNVSARVGRFLATAAPKTAAKLALSTTATIIPEGVSTVLGLAGMAWTAYDIFNLAQQMPELYALIFEDTPEESVEDKVMNEMSAQDDLFTPGEQPRTD